MTDDDLRELRPGDRVLINPTSMPHESEARPEQAIFVTFADSASGIPVMIVSGLADGWDEKPNLPFGLRVVTLGQVLKRLTEDERIEILRRRLRQMARVVA